MPESHVRRVVIKGQEAALDVDTLNIESTVTGEIDTSTATSPLTVLTPSSGKKISARGVAIHSDSTSGEIAVKFATSGKLVGKLYCSVMQALLCHALNVVGDTDEPLQIEWSGLSTGAKIFYAIRYKEV